MSLEHHHPPETQPADCLACAVTIVRRALPLYARGTIAALDLIEGALATHPKNKPPRLPRRHLMDDLTYTAELSFVVKDLWVAHCPELELVAEGRSEDQAVEALRESVKDILK